MSTAERKPFIACNSSPAMSGYFASLYQWTQETDYGFYEPYESDCGRYATLDEAEAAGRVWAAQYGVEFIPVDRERAARTEQTLRLRVALTKQLRDSGMDFKSAYFAAKEKYPYE